MKRSAKQEKRILKRWLRRLIRGGVYLKAPDWVVEQIHGMGVPIQVEAERHGSAWEYCTFLEDMIDGEKVNGEARASNALNELDAQRTIVVNRRRESFDVAIDRSTKWGNPYHIGPDGDRDEVCDKHEAWLLTQIHLLRALEELRGLRLGCWCPPKRCHGDTYVRFLEEGIPWRSIPGRRKVK